MSGIIEDYFPNVKLGPDGEAKLSAEDKATLEKDRKDLKTIARWLAGHPRKNSLEKDSPAFKEGLQTFKARKCGGCHVYEGEGGTRKDAGPDLTGYGDNEWLQIMLLAPHLPRRYGLLNTMPLFRDPDRSSSETFQDELNQVRELLKQTGTKEDEIKAATRVVP